MRQSRFTDEQIVAKLRESERTSVAAVAKAYAVSDQQSTSGVRSLGPCRPMNYGA